LLFYVVNKFFVHKNFREFLICFLFLKNAIPIVSFSQTKKGLSNPSIVQYKYM